MVENINKQITNTVMKSKEISSFWHLIDAESIFELFLIKIFYDFFTNCFLMEAEERSERNTSKKDSIAQDQ